MRTVNCLVGGADQPASNGRTFERRNPVSGVVVTRAPAATLDDAQAAVAAASSAFPIWSALTPNERRRRLLKAADSLASRASEFAATGIEETGGTPGWFYFNVALAADMLREAACMTTQITGETIPSNVPGCVALSIRKPCGVVVGIAPWNAPVTTVHDEPQMPFGGVKASGFGRFGGRYAVHEFTELQWITVQTTPPHYPI